MDSHLIGTAQLTTAGVASFKFIPGPGAHTYKAVFAGTKTNATSSSASASLMVSTGAGTAGGTTLTASGSAGNYTLTATVATKSGQVPPTGVVSFLDTNNANYVLGSAALSADPNSLTWVNSATPATGPGAQDVAVADFNGDGILDMATPNSGGTTLNIFLGKGDGTFTRAPDQNTGSFPIVARTGDFNADGNVDLVAVNLGSTGFPPYINSYLTILLGNGDGTFTAAPNVDVGSAPEDVAIGDFNGDGNADLAVANFNNDTVTILLGNGDGTFVATAESPATGLAPIAIVTGDFNQDGIPDLVTAHFGTFGLPPNFGPSPPTILLGNGDGTFRAVASPATTSGTTEGMVMADFNGDGIPDFATHNNLGSPITVFLANGDGTFTRKDEAPFPYSSLSMTAGDFNGDGIADLATTFYYPAAEAVFLLGKGDGTFTVAPQMPSLPPNPYYVRGAAADFNGDGLTDFAVGDGSISSVTVLLSQAGAATASISGVSPVGTGTHLVDASYAGDGNYSAGLSNTVALTALRVPTSMRLVAAPASSTAGQQVALTATVSPDTAQDHDASGIVTFYNGASIIGTAQLVNGTAALNDSSLPIGRDSLTAVYAGDTNFVGATSSAVPVNVAGIPGALSLSASQNSLPIFAPLSLNYVVAGTSGSPVPTGSLALSDGSTPLVTLNLPPAAGSYPTSLFPAGVHSILGNYSGDSNYAASSATVKVTAVALTGSLGLSASINPSVYGQALSVTAQLGSTATLTPSQMQQLFAGASVTLSGLTASPIVLPVSATGAATVTFPASAPLSAGTYNLGANFAGSSNLTATNAALQITVKPAPTGTTISASSTTLAPGESVTLTAHTATPAGASGTVRFSDGTAVLATIPLLNGAATFTTSALSLGEHNIVATYSGDGNDLASESAPLEVEVLATAIGVELSTNSLTLRTGHNATIEVTVSSLGGFTGPVSLSATTLPPYVTVQLTPSQMQLTSGQAQTSKLYLDTDALLHYLSSETQDHSPASSRAPLLAIVPFALFGLRRRRRILLMLVSVGFLSLVACSGRYPASTPPGTYVIQVHAASSQKSVSAVAPLTLIVTE